MCVVGSLARADEGMWTLDALPMKQMQAAYGFAPDAKWVDRVRAATVQLDSGCTGSFVSGTGLILTNHHCVEDCMRTLSALKKVNYSATPFVAKTAQAEQECPDAEALQLLSTEDVTAKVNAATKGTSIEGFHAAWLAISGELEKACVGADRATIRCELIDLYHGGQYVMHRYKRYTELRIVFAPEETTAAFGGDPDNFNFPRYALDMALLRAYENGKPAVTPVYFPFRVEGAKVGEPIFVLGHPGTTDRLLTVAELEYQRDVALPSRLIERSFMRGMLHEFARQNEHFREISLEPITSLENSIKVRRGEFQTLTDPRLMARKRAEEQALRAAVGKDPALAKDVGDPWAELAALVIKERPLAFRHDALRMRTKLLDLATELVRGAEQRTKPEADRLPEFSDRRLPDHARTLAAPSALYPELEERVLAAGLYRMRDTLGADEPVVKAVLGHHSPEALAKDAVKGTKLFDPKVRKALWEGGKAAIDASKDPMIALAKAFEPEVLALRKKYESEIDGPERRASERVAKAYFAIHKRDTYPDATFTLRLSYGSIKGWTRDDGKVIEPLTVMGGSYERATGEDPYILPKSWLAAKSKLKLDTPFNFVTDNDIVGGNSGSPMLDKEGRVVGLAFDGNTESIGGAYWFDEAVNRCVSLHPAAMLEALKVIYGAPALVSELTTH